MNYSHFHYLRILAILSCWMIGSNTFAQIEPLWDRSFGGTGWEELNSAEETEDGGYILGGYSSSTINGDVTFPNQGIGDFWVVKTDHLGVKEWDARFGGPGLDRCNSVIQTTDGGYLFAGTSGSDIGGQKQTANRGVDDYWVVKTDANGLLQWEQTYGGADFEILSAVIQTPDGGYLLGGMSASDIGNEKSEPNLGGLDFWFVKIDPNGNLLWDKTIGGSAEERLNTMQIAPDGNFLLAGSTQSDVGDDITIPSIGIKDFWFVKVSAIDGSIIWQRRYGGGQVEELIAFEQTLDGGFFLCGGSNSDISPWKSENSRAGSIDMWGLKIDADGNYEWDVTFGGDQLDNCYALKQNSAGFFMLGGFSGSDVGPDKTEPNRGGWDYWVVYIDENGNKLWDRTIGGNQNDVLFNLFQNSDGGYILAGASDSPISGDKNFDTNGLNDFWLVKTVCDLELNFRDTMICPNQPLELNAFQNPTCIDCIYDWSDIGRGDSIRMITTTVDEIYQVTITDNTGCQKINDLSITVLTSPVVDLGNNQTICEGTTATLDAGNNTMLDYQWSGNNEITNTIEVETAGRYFVTVTNSNSCSEVDSVDVFVNALPIVNLGADTMLCPNQTLTLDAENPGSSFNWSPSGNSQVETFSPSGPMTIAVSVTDNNNCVGMDTIDVLGIYNSPVVSDSTIICSVDNNSYTVSFTVTNGEPATYEVLSAINFGRVGNVFTSDPIPRDEPYSFSITDAQDCTPYIFSGVGDCPCASQAGSPDLTPIEICGDAEITIDFAGQFLDGNDVVNYIMHDGNETTIGTILLTSTTAEVTYNPMLDYNTTYYCTALVGNDDGTGMVDTNDGCFAQSAGAPIIFRENPTALIVPQTGTSLSCDQPSVILSAQDAQPVGNLEFQWTTADGAITGSTNQMNIEATAGGTYQLIVTTIGTSCQDTVTAVLTSGVDFPVINIQSSGELTCVDTVVILDATASSEGSNFQAIWTGNNIDGNTNLVQTITEPGLYQLAITNTENGCMDSLSIQINENIQTPSITAGTPTALDCESGTAQLSGEVFGGLNNYTVIWSTTDGNILNNETALNPEVDLTGVYTLEVTNEDNGCTATDIVAVGVDPDGPTDAIFILNDPTCFGENDGSIIIDSVVGGTMPYLIGINGSALSATNQFGRLTAGIYDITIQDLEGCSFTTTVELIDPNPFQIFTGTEEEIALGDSIRLQGQFSNTVDTFYWNEALGLSCVDCLRPIARPVNTTAYTLTGIDENGCSESATVLVTVKKERLIYIPSAFSPNDDGLNDYFVINAGTGVESVEYLRIYNRWGAVIFEAKNFQPNDFRNSWDGKMKGEQVQMGVYVYSLKARFVDGEELMYQGDVTVVRSF